MLGDRFSCRAVAHGADPALRQGKISLTFWVAS